MTVLGEKEKRMTLGGHHVVIDVYHYGDGADTTASTFTVSVYGTCGEKYNWVSMSGYMLEPRTDSSLATTAGSDTAIPPGSYPVSQRADQKWELSGVEGRSNIQIHTGNTGANTTGCLMPATKMSYKNGNYYVPGGYSSSAFNQLQDIMSEYGDMITLVVH
jgi:hypothetical protein